MDEVSRGGAAGTAEVRPIRPDDAPMITQLVERCYADGYHKDVMYRPDELAGMIRSGSHNGVVAEAEGMVVGHMAYLWPNENATVVEAGITVVDPGWRGKGIMGRLAVAMGEMLAAGGAIGFVHYPTTAHEVMQRASLSSGGRETGIMLAFLPPETRDHSIAEGGDQRLAVTVVYQPILKSKPQAIFVPGRFEELLLGLAEELGLERTAAQPLRDPAGDTLLEVSPDASPGLEHIRVARIGTDVADRVTSSLAESDARVVHVDLPMNDPGIDYAAGQLKPAGFAYSAWLPCWDGHDVLRLQRIAEPSPLELNPSLFSPEAGFLMEVIRPDLPGSASASTMRP